MFWKIQSSKELAFGFKNDKASLKTGMFYVEYEQTSDGWFSRKSSGHALAIMRGCVLIISSGSKCLVFNEASFAEMEKGYIRTCKTRLGVNGNPRGCQTRAKLVPVPFGVKTASFMYDMSVTSS